jgi:hypothetical protein
MNPLMPPSGPVLLTTVTGLDHRDVALLPVNISVISFLIPVRFPTTTIFLIHYSRIVDQRAFFRYWVDYKGASFDFSRKFRISVIHPPMTK